jgi:glutathione synthase/RimK-type ligase-like ATP-grasp enzyme
MTVLILGRSDDWHVLSVSKQLSKLNAAFSLFKYDDLFKGTQLNFSVMPQNNSCSIQLPTGSMIDLARVDAVWFRRPGSLQYSGLPEPWINSMVENEARCALAGIFRSLNCLFVNHPGRDYDCSFKLWQLEVAKRVGLVVPKTVVTNMPEVVAKFYEECGGRVIYKLVGEASLQQMPLFGTASGIDTVFTRPLEQDDFAHLSQIRMVPHLFQERIDKVYDIRVTAIGKKLFPVKIESQTGKGKLDWRLDYDVPMKLIELPADISNSCLDLLKALGLNYGAIDLCVDKNGRHTFFEINCVGQYAWMEDRIEELELSLELAKLLIGQGDPIVPRAAYGQEAVPSSWIPSAS